MLKASDGANTFTSSAMRSLSWSVMAQTLSLRADEGGDALRAHRHVTGIRHDGEELDFETLGQLHLFQILFDLLSLLATLLDGLHLHGRAGCLEIRQLLQIVSGLRRSADGN